MSFPWLSLRKALMQVRSAYHPLWVIRRSRVMRPLMCLGAYPYPVRLKGLRFPFYVYLLRDLSWMVLDDMLEAKTKVAFDFLMKNVAIKEFWDVGANVGFYTWLVKSMKADVSCTLFEPDVRNARLLRKTIRTNNLKEIRLFQGAVCEKNGMELFHEDFVSGATGQINRVFETRYTHLHEYNIHSSYEEVNRKTYEVNTCTLDHMVDKYQKVPDLVKIDVEAAEELVLNGARGLIEMKRTVFIVEVTTVGIHEVFQRAGYVHFLLDEQELNYIFIPPRYADTLATPIRSISETGSPRRCG